MLTSLWQVYDHARWVTFAGVLIRTPSLILVLISFRRYAKEGTR